MRLLGLAILASVTVGACSLPAFPPGGTDGSGNRDAARFDTILPSPDTRQPYEPCNVNGGIYQPGESFTINCMTYTCLGGTNLNITASPCSDAANSIDVSTMNDAAYARDFMAMSSPDTLQPCTVGGVTYQPGQSFTNNCITYTCAGGTNLNSMGSSCSDAANADVANLDGVKPDVGRIDAVNADAGENDEGKTDDANADAANRDLGNTDVGTTDALISDAANADAANLDLGNTDAGTTDAGTTDTGTTDVGNIDGLVVPAIVINLGLASPFAIAATAGVTNTTTAPITHINGNVVLTLDQTCNAVTVDNAGGFGLCGGMSPTINGSVITNTYPDTTTATAIKADLNAAFLSITPLAGPPAVGSLGGGTPIAAPTTLGNVTGSALVLGDNWFTPGVYVSNTSILITGDLTLDGQGDPNAIFIFQSASTLTTADGASIPGAHTRILLTNGTKASNVWWQVAGSATIGLYSEFQGNILAVFDIIMKTGSATCGRSMAGAWVGGNGSFVFDSNVVSVPGNGCSL